MRHVRQEVRFVLGSLGQLPRFFLDRFASLFDLEIDALHFLLLFGQQVYLFLHFLVGLLHLFVGLFEFFVGLLQFFLLLFELNFGGQQAGGLGFKLLIFGAQLRFS